MVFKLCNCIWVFLKSKGEKKYEALLIDWPSYVDSNSYEELQTFKYLGSLSTNQNSIHEEIKCKNKVEKWCYYSVQTVLSSPVLPNNHKIKIYETIILPVVFYGWEIWPLTFEQECRLGAGSWRECLVPKGWD